MKTDAPAEDRSDELREVLDRELAALPDVYRAAVVLCDLEGLSRSDAALRLGSKHRRVRLISPPSPVEKVLEILGWHELDALEVARSRA